VIAQEFDSQKRLLWLGYSDSPKAHLQPLLEKNYTNGRIK
jgi:hypothetical protein